MDLVGRIENLYKDFKSGRWNILISLNQQPAEELNDLLDADLAVSLKKRRNKRSLDANAYFYVLVNKIAERQGISDVEVHDKLLSENLCYITEGGAVDWLISDRKANNYRLLRIGEDYYYDSLQNVVLQKPSGDMYKTQGKPKTSRIYWHVKGSHQMDSKEMARLIDATVLDAKALGIETMTCDELIRLKEMWKVN